MNYTVSGVRHLTIYFGESRLNGVITGECCGHQDTMIAKQFQQCSSRFAYRMCFCIVRNQACVVRRH